MKTKSKVKPKAKPAAPKKQANASGKSPASKVEAATRPVKVKVPAKSVPAIAEVARERVKLVRDSFTMPRDDFELLDQLKARATEFRRPAKKSELLRAGLQVLVRLDDAQLHAALEALRPLKAGRPKNKH
ncbi:MAG TPA: hypothetical protein VET30_09660 [Pseudoxanthomonas sp.]|nr:hypothetical protein [Pseudoxanthomonas sp.]